MTMDDGWGYGIEGVVSKSRVRDQTSPACEEGPVKFPKLFLAIYFYFLATRLKAKTITTRFLRFISLGNLDATLAYRGR